MLGLLGESGLSALWPVFTEVTGSTPDKQYLRYQREYHGHDAGHIHSPAQDVVPAAGQFGEVPPSLPEQVS